MFYLNKNACIDIQVINVKKRKRNETSSCSFCDKTDNLVVNPKAQSFENILRAAVRRKDEINEKIKSNTDFTEHNCTWHRNCMASYISEE